MSKLDELGLSDDYEEKKSGLGQFTSKPTQRQFQPFGGPLKPQQPQNQVSQVQNPFPAEQPQYVSPLDDLGTYDQYKTNYSAISKEASNYGQISSRWNSLYDDSLENEIRPFYDQLGLYDDIQDKASGDEYIASIDKEYARLNKLANSEDGWFGSSDEKLGAQEALKRFGSWGGENGLRSKFFKLKQERDNRKLMSDQANDTKVRMLEEMTSIPLDQRMAMDEALKSRGKGEKDPREINKILDSMQWEDPVVDFNTGEITNLHKVDPRRKSPTATDFNTGQNAGQAAQSKRRQQAFSGDIDTIMSERAGMERRRNMQNRGFMVGHSGTAPRGMSNDFIDILDADKLKDAGFTEFKGLPIEEAIAQLGGAEKIEAAKVMKSALQAKEIFRNSQLELLKEIGGANKNSDQLKLKVDKARQNWHGALKVAGDFGLSSRLYEQLSSAEDQVGFWEGIKNEWNRGLKQADMADLSLDFAMGQADESDIQTLIDISQDIEDIPTSSALKRISSGKSKNLMEAVGLIFGNAEALPELIAGVTSAYFPTMVNTFMKYTGPAALGHGAIQKMRGKGGLFGTIGLGARLNAGVASAALEYNGKLMEEMSGLGVDVHDPKIFMAAWQSPQIREALKDTALAKSFGVGLMDSVGGLMAGRIGQTTRYLGMKGGKHVDATRWAKKHGRSDWQQAGIDMPVFSSWQRFKSSIVPETGAQMGFGMGGEALGQYLAMKPGESFDWDAIAAEGALEIVSPFGIYGAMSEAWRGGKREAARKNFAQATPTYSNVQPMTIDGQQVGSQGTVTRAGLVQEFRQYDSADNAAADMIQAAGINFDPANPNSPENRQAQVIQDFMFRFQEMNPEKFKELRWVVAERTPDSIDSEGLFEHYDDPSFGGSTVFLNADKMKENPIRGLFHEGAHWARLSIFKDVKDLMSVYNSLTSEQKLNSFAEYHLKIPNAKFSALEDGQKSEVMRRFQDTSSRTQAEEWFALQFARNLAGNPSDRTVAQPVKKFMKKFVYPLMEGKMGSVDNAGAFAAQVDGVILNAMGWGPTGVRMGDTLQDQDWSADGVRGAALPEGMEQMSQEEGIKWLWEKIQKYDKKDQGPLIETIEALMGGNKIFMTPEVSAFTKSDDTPIGKKEAKKFADPEAKKWSKEKVDLLTELYEDVDGDVNRMLDAQVPGEKSEGKTEPRKSEDVGEALDTEAIDKIRKVPGSPSIEGDPAKPDTLSLTPSQQKNLNNVLKNEKEFDALKKYIKQLRKVNTPEAIAQIEKAKARIEALKIDPPAEKTWDQVSKFEESLLNDDGTPKEFQLGPNVVRFIPFRGKALTDGGGRVWIKAEINGVEVPFYQSTGLGQKILQTGKFYPSPGVGGTWVNKLSSKQMAEFYGSPEMAQVSAFLEQGFGDITPHEGKINLRFKESIPGYDNLTIKEQKRHAGQFVKEQRSWMNDGRTQVELDEKGAAASIRNEMARLAKLIEDGMPAPVERTAEKPLPGKPKSETTPTRTGAQVRVDEIRGQEEQVYTKDSFDPQKAATRKAVIESLKKIEELITDPKKFKKALVDARNKLVNQRLEALGIDSKGVSTEDWDNVVRQISWMDVLREMSEFDTLLSFGKGGRSQWGLDLIDRFTDSFDMPEIDAVEEAMAKGEADLGEAQDMIRQEKLAAMDEQQALEKSIKKVKKPFEKKSETRGNQKLVTSPLDPKKGYKEMVNLKKTNKPKKGMIQSKEKFQEWIKKNKGKATLKDWETASKNSLVKKKGNKLVYIPGEGFALLYKTTVQEKAKKEKAIPEGDKRAIHSGMIKAIQEQIRAEVGEGLEASEVEYFDRMDASENFTYVKQQARFFRERGHNENFMIEFFNAIMNSEGVVVKIGGKTYGKKGKRMRVHQFMNMLRDAQSLDQNQKKEIAALPTSYEKTDNFANAQKFNERVAKLLIPRRGKTKTAKNTGKKQKSAPTRDYTTYASQVKEWAKFAQVMREEVKSRQPDLVDEGKDQAFTDELSRRIAQTMRLPRAYMDFMQAEAKTRRQKALARHIELLQEAEMLFAPENYGVDWKNVRVMHGPFANTFIKEGGVLKPLTLGVLSTHSNKGWGGALKLFDKKGYPKKYKGKDGKQMEIADGQHLLGGVPFEGAKTDTVTFYDQFDLKKITPDLSTKSKDPNTYHGAYGMTPRQYKLYVAAAQASMHQPITGRGLNTNDLRRRVIVQGTPDEGTSLLTILAKMVWEANAESLDGSAETRKTRARMSTQMAYSPEDYLLAEVAKTASYTGAEMDQTGLTMMWLQHNKVRELTRLLSQLKDQTWKDRGALRAKQRDIEKLIQYHLHAEPYEKGRITETFRTVDIKPKSRAERRRLYQRYLDSFKGEKPLPFDSDSKKYRKFENQVTKEQERTGTMPDADKFRFRPPVVEEYKWTSWNEMYEYYRQEDIAFLKDKYAFEKARLGDSNKTGKFPSLTKWLNQKDKNGNYTNRVRVEGGFGDVQTNPGGREKPQPDRIPGGKMWTEALGQYDYWHWKMKAIDEILTQWEEEIGPLGGWHKKAGKAYTDAREALSQAHGEQADRLFVDDLLEKRFKQKTGNDSWKDNKAFSKFKEQHKNLYEGLTRQSKELNKLQRERRKVMHNPDLSDSQKESILDEFYTRITREQEKIRKVSVAKRKDIFQMYRDWYLEFIGKDANQELAETMLNTIERNFVEQTPQYGENGEVYYVPQFSWNVGNRTGFSRREDKYPRKFRNDGYAYVELDESLDNPDFKVEAQEGAHGEFKRVNLDKTYNILSLYKSQADKVFGQLKKTGEGLGAEFEIPDRVRDDAGRFAKWNATYKDREDLSATFMAQGAEDGEKISFKGVDADGVDVEIDAIFKNGFWEYEDGSGQLSVRPGTEVINVTRIDQDPETLAAQKDPELNIRKAIDRGEDRSPDSKAGTTAELYNRPSLHDQATEAWLAEQEKKGVDRQNAASSDSHYTAARLAEQIFKLGVRSFTHFADTEVTGDNKSTPGQQFAPYIIQRILHPLLERMYKDLNIDLDAKTGNSTEEFPQTYGDLLEKLDRLTKLKTQVDMDSAAVEPPMSEPKLLIVNDDKGEKGKSDLIREWFEQNGMDPGEAGRTYAMDERKTVEASEETLPDGTVKKSKERKENDQEIDVDNLTEAGISVIFKSSKDGSARFKNLVELAKDDSDRMTIVVDISDKDFDISKVVRGKGGILEQMGQGIEFEPGSIFIFADTEATTSDAKITAVLDYLFKGDLPPAKDTKSKAEGRKGKRAVDVNFGKGINPELSPLYDLAKPFEHEGRKFYSVEAAYQAFKNPQAVKDGEINPDDFAEQSDGPTLTGKEARTWANELGVKADTKISKELMRTLLRKRYDTDSEFKRRLGQIRGPITHSVKDEFWKEALPELLEELSTEAAKSAWFNDSNLWGDTDTAELSAWLSDIREAIEPIMTAAFNGRRVDQLDEKVEQSIMSRDSGAYQAEGDKSVFEQKEAADKGPSEPGEDVGDTESQESADGDATGTKVKDREDPPEGTFDPDYADKQAGQTGEPPSSDNNIQLDDIKQKNIRMGIAVRDILESLDEVTNWTEDEILGWAISNSYHLDDAMSVDKPGGFESVLPENSSKLTAEFEKLGAPPKAVDNPNFDLEIGQWVSKIAESDNNMLQLVWLMWKGFWGKAEGASFTKWRGDVQKQIDRLEAGDLDGPERMGKMGEDFQAGSQLPPMSEIPIFKKLREKPREFAVPLGQVIDSMVKRLEENLSVALYEKRLGMSERDPRLRGIYEVLTAFRTLYKSRKRKDGDESHGKVKFSMFDSAKRQAETGKVILGDVDVDSESGDYTMRLGDIHLDNSRDVASGYHTVIHEIFHVLTHRFSKLLTGVTEKNPGMARKIKLISKTDLLLAEDQKARGEKIQVAGVYNKYKSAFENIEKLHEFALEEYNRLAENPFGIGLKERLAYGFDGAGKDAQLVEFITEAGSNIEMQRFLDGIEITDAQAKSLGLEPTTGSKSTLWQAFVNVLKDFFGLKVDGTVLGEVLRESSTFLEDPEAKLREYTDALNGVDKFVNDRLIQNQKNQRLEQVWSDDVQLGSQLHIPPNQLESLAQGKVSSGNLVDEITDLQRYRSELQLLANLFGEEAVEDSMKNISTKEHRLLRSHWLQEFVNPDFFPEVFKLYGVDYASERLPIPWGNFGFAREGKITRDGKELNRENKKARRMLIDILQSGGVEIRDFLLAMRKDYKNRARLLRKALKPENMSKVRRIMAEHPDFRVANESMPARVKATIDTLYTSIRGELAYVGKLDQFLNSLYKLTDRAKFANTKVRFVNLTSPIRKDQNWGAMVRPQIIRDFGDHGHKEKVGGMRMYMGHGAAPHAFIHELIHVLAESHIGVGTTKKFRDRAVSLFEEDNLGETVEDPYADLMKFPEYKADKVIGEIRKVLDKEHARLPDGILKNKTAYGSVTNNEEVVTEALSNPVFQKWLKSIKTPKHIADLVKDAKTGWTPSNLWEAFVIAFKKLLGLKIDGTLMEATLDMSGIIIDASQKPEILQNDRPFSFIEGIARKHTIKRSKARTKALQPLVGESPNIEMSEVAEALDSLDAMENDGQFGSQLGDSRKGNTPKGKGFRPKHTEWSKKEFLPNRYALKDKDSLWDMFVAELSWVAGVDTDPYDTEGLLKELGANPELVDFTDKTPEGYDPADDAPAEKLPANALNELLKKIFWPSVHPKLNLLFNASNETVLKEMALGLDGFLEYHDLRKQDINWGEVRKYMRQTPVDPAERMDDRAARKTIRAGDPGPYDIQLGSQLVDDGADNHRKAGFFATMFNKDNWKELYQETKRGSTQAWGQGSKKDIFIIDYVDKFHPLKKMFYEVKDIVGPMMEKGTPLYDALNTWGKVHTYLGLGQSELEQHQIKYHHPMMNAIREAGTTVEVVGEYLLARMAPSRNHHHTLQIKDALKDVKNIKDKKKREARRKELNERLKNKALSGIPDDAAIDVVKKLEAGQAVGNLTKEQAQAFVRFMDHENSPLQLFYEQQLEDLTNRATMDVIATEEVSRMKVAASYFDWQKAGSKFKFKDADGKLSNYSYAPMQGFEGEFQSIVDTEKAWELLGQGTKSSGKGFDQPKQVLLAKGAFGRYKDENGKPIKPPDPTQVLGTSEQQYVDGSIRGNKNTVANAYGKLHDMMRRVAFGKEEDYPTPDSFEGVDLDKLHKDENIRKKMEEEYHSIFKTHVQTVDKMEYNWDDVDPSGRWKMVQKRINTSFANDPHVFVYRKEGTPVYLSFQETGKGKMMAAALKNMRYESLPEILGQVNGITKRMSQMATSRNPGFIIPNFVRDLGSALIHLTEDDKRSLVKNALNLKNIHKFGKAAFEAELSLRKDKKSPVDIKGFKGGDLAMAQKIMEEGDAVKMYMFAKANGAMVGYFNTKGVPDIIKSMRKEAENPSKAPKRMWEKTVAYMDAMNAYAEQSIRISSFWAAIKDGRSTQEAALISRRVTVDFNQGGNKANAINALYMFFRASITGINRSWNTLKKRSWKERFILVGGIMGTSYAWAIVSRLLDDDEDEDTEPLYDQVSPYVRHRKIVIPVPSWLLKAVGMEDDGFHMTINLPLGMPASIWGAGQQLADMTSYYTPGIRGGHGIFESAGNFATSLQDMGNPMGGVGLTEFVPSPIKPWVEVMANQDFTGKEIVYPNTPWGDPKPAHTRDPKQTPAFWTGVSKQINEWGGGTDDSYGSVRGMLGQNPLEFSEEEDWKWDWSGNQIRHIIFGYLMGVGQTAEGAILSAAGGVDDFDFAQVPVAQRFLKSSTYGGRTRSKVNHLRDAVFQAENVVENAPAEVRAQERKRQNKLLQFLPDVKQIDRVKQKYRDQKQKVQDSKMSDVEKAHRIANLEAKELELMTKVINRAQKAGLAI
tara:strand:+ start:2983 stop:20520 length:17538 start_codon:yes stop_codon:yes gene_type:complete